MNPNFRPTPRQAPARRPGRGVIDVQNVGGRSLAVQLRAESPLRLLAPRGVDGNGTWIYTSNFGGGLVGGDQIDLDMTVGLDANCLLMTQASTKVYRSENPNPTQQNLKLVAAAGATCAVLPDPLTCFSGATFAQRVDVDLAGSATLVLLDWLTSGRRARGERWAFSHYQSLINVRVGSRLVFRDSIRLAQADGPIAAEQRMGRCDCLALLLLVGPRVQNASGDILKWVAAQPIQPAGELIFSASPLGDGAVLRVAGTTTQAVERWIRQRLAFVPDLLGGDPWRRKS